MPVVRRVWPYPIDGELVNSTWLTNRFNEFRQEFPGVSAVTAHELESVVEHRRWLEMRGVV